MLENQKEEALAFCPSSQSSQLYTTVENSKTLHFPRICFFLLPLQPNWERFSSCCFNVFIYVWQDTSQEYSKLEIYISDYKWSNVAINHNFRVQGKTTRKQTYNDDLKNSSRTYPGVFIHLTYFSTCVFTTKAGSAFCISPSPICSQGLPFKYLCAPVC